MRQLPAWVPGMGRALVAGLVYAGGQALAGGWSDPERWPWWLASGALFGAILVPVFTAVRRREDAATGLVTGEERRRARRAARYGPVPADPRVREAATRLAVHRLAELSRLRAREMIVLGFFVVLTMLLAVAGFPVLWLVAAVLVVLLAEVSGWRPRRLRRRVELLRGAPVP